MPPVVAAAVIGAAGAFGGAALNAHAQGKAADKSLKANDNALAFQKQQAEAAYKSDEATRHANYDQWAASQRRLGSIGETLGLPSREIPGYVSMPDPNLAGPSMPGAPSPPPAASPASAAGAGNPNDPRVQAIVQQVTQGLPPTSQSLDAVIAELNKNGITAKRATHMNGTLPSDDKIDFGNGSGLDLIFNVGAPDAKWTLNAYGPSTGAAPQTAMGSVNSYLTPFAKAPMTPALQAPKPYGMGSVGSYLG